MTIRFTRRAAEQRAPIRLGGLTTLEGPFATGGQDAYRCVQIELERINSTIGGRRIEFIRESSNAQADVALARARKLIEQDNVDIILGPLSGAEGIALRDYSRTLTGKTIVNGSSGAADTTLRNPSPNFFRFSTDGTQWMAGLGNHVYRNLNIREVAVTAGDYAFPYAQVFGFNIEFCRAGGRVQHYWAPLGTTDFTSQIAQINRSNAGAIVIVHGGTDGLAFMTQYAQAGGNKPLIAGSIMADQTMLSARGPHRRVMVGMISGGPIADVIDDPNWREFVERYRRRWLNEGGFQSPSIHGVNYTTNLYGILHALRAVDGDLSNNQAPAKSAGFDVTPSAASILIRQPTLTGRSRFSVRRRTKLPDSPSVSWSTSGSSAMRAPSSSGMVSTALRCGNSMPGASVREITKVSSASGSVSPWIGTVKVVVADPAAKRATPEGKALPAKSAASAGWLPPATTLQGTSATTPRGPPRSSVTVSAVVPASPSAALDTPAKVTVASSLSTTICAVAEPGTNRPKGSLSLISIVSSASTAESVRSCTEITL
ncbi:ABC transporter substrate-binding protein [Leptolyngbya sp. 15MV]|nr:ABC transporter substrate-binding protein [Leptolyngbya sp. 15MV]